MSYQHSKSSPQKTYIFNVTGISTSSCAIITCMTCHFTLNLNESVVILVKSIIAKYSMLLRLCNIEMNVLFFLIRYPYILTSRMLASPHQYLWHYQLTYLYCLFDLSN